MIFVLDASAMIAFLRDEPGADFVADAILDPSSRCYAHALNLCEVYYDFHRAAGRVEAMRAIADLRDLGVLADSNLAVDVGSQKKGIVLHSSTALLLGVCIICCVPAILAASRQRHQECQVKNKRGIVVGLPVALALLTTVLALLVFRR